MPADLRYFLYRDPAVVGTVVQRAREGLAPPSAWAAPWGFRACGFAERLVAADDADGFLVPVAFSAKDTYDWTTEDGVPAAAVDARFRAMDAAIAASLDCLGHLARRRERHVFVQWGDLIDDFPSLSGSIVLKVSARSGSAAVPIPYFVADLEERVRAGLPLRTPIEAAAIDVDFRGRLDSTPLRRGLPAAVDGLRKAGRSVAFEVTRFGGSAAERRAYLDGIRDARFVLCPRGTGLGSVRFFETLALGRIPILIADGARLPLEERIAYDEFVVRVPEPELGDVAGHVADFLRRRDLRIASRAAHAAWLGHLTSWRLAALVDDAVAARREPAAR